MTYYYTGVEMDLADYEDLVNDVSSAPTIKMVLALEAVLTEAFAKTQAAVHMQTGALRASGRVSSTISNGVWEGTIHYGTPNAVEYAWYEDRRGGPHNFMRAAFEMGDEFADAIEDTWVD